MYLQAGSILQKIDYQLFKMKPQKIVIAIDSFKGCLTSAEAGEAAAQGVHAACPECQTIVEKACSTSYLQPVTENVSPSVPTTR